MVDEVRKLTMQQVLDAEDLAEEDLFVPQWNGTVHIKAFTKAEQQAYREASRNPDTGQIEDNKLETMIFVTGVRDPKFQQSDYERLRTKNAQAIDIVIARLMRISGLSAGSVKEAEKSFPDGGSGTE